MMTLPIFLIPMMDRLISLFDKEDRSSHPDGIRSIGEATGKGAKFQRIACAQQKEYWCQTARGGVGVTLSAAVS